MMNDEASEHSNSDAPTRSSVSAIRCSGIRCSRPARNSSSASRSAVCAVSTNVGDSALTVIAVLRPLRRLLARQRVERALRGDVGGEAVVDPELPADGGEVQHPAAAPAGDHRPHGGVGRQEDRAEVEVGDPVPLVLRVGLGRVQRRAGAAADGVDDHVDAAERRQRLVDHPLGLLAPGHVRDHGDRLAGELSRDLLGARPVTAVRRDPRADPRQRLRDPAADAAGRARDDGDLPVEPESPQLVDLPCAHPRPPPIIDYRA